MFTELITEIKKLFGSQLPSNKEVLNVFVYHHFHLKKVIQESARYVKYFYSYAFYINLLHF